eukprot:CAMPEP_0117667628 /NCGR_PEP_ID=MMETSP0804-20121206/11077_1 /TAXON_ID=1074897 /ORGANISM="Tetraselmis astigmatica, Strain CCMP880" /LENGTH=288 /DNA_ID=CAMNT_0005475385 /DNA_START=82 /DNA_END=948 /DNA_ORIENTATION=-
MPRKISSAEIEIELIFCRQNCTLLSQGLMQALAFPAVMLQLLFLRVAAKGLKEVGTAHIEAVAHDRGSSGETAIETGEEATDGQRKIILGPSDLPGSVLAKSDDSYRKRSEIEEKADGYRKGTRDSSDIPGIILVKPDDSYRTAVGISVGDDGSFAALTAPNATQKPPLRVEPIFRVSSEQPANTSYTRLGDMVSSAVNLTGSTRNPKDRNGDDGVDKLCNWNNWRDNWSPAADEGRGCCVCHKYRTAATVQRCMLCCCSKGHSAWTYQGCKGLSKDANPECAPREVP